MEYPNKIAIIIKNDLQTWQKLNVAAFLAGSVAIAFPGVHGKAFVNASRETYLPFIKQPILIYKGEDEAQIKRAFFRAKERGLNIGIYTQPLFSTKSETENLAEIARLTDQDQQLAGIIIYGESKKVSKALDGLRLHD